MTESVAVWPDEAIEAIHLAALALLERAGVRVESPAARELLLAAGCTPAGEDRLLDPARASSTRRWPPARPVRARRARPERSLAMDPDPGVTYVHNMGGARDVGDPRTRRRAARDAARPGPRDARHAPPREPAAGHVAAGSPRTCPTCSSRCTRT